MPTFARKFFFTLIELVVAMGVFAVLMVALMQFFSSAQSLWVKSSQNIEIYQNARALMELMTRDIQCVIYNNNADTSSIYPFWYESTSKLNLISTTDMRSSYAKSPICVVKYAWANGATGNTVYTNGYSGTTVDSNSADQINWIVRSCTCDMKFNEDTAQSAPMYNFWNHPRKNISSGVFDRDRAVKTFQQDSGQTTEDFSKVIPYVVKFKITCQGSKTTFTDEEVLTPKSETDLAGLPAEDASYVTPLPSIVTVEFGLLDKTSWDKWIAMGGNRSAVPAPGDADISTSSEAAFRRSKEVDFSFSVYLNNRVGQ
jgi:type II secretory pathway component PulJ